MFKTFSSVFDFFRLKSLGRNRHWTSFSDAKTETTKIGFVFISFILSILNFLCCPFSLVRLATSTFKLTSLPRSASAALLCSLNFIILPFLFHFLHPHALSVFFILIFSFPHYHHQLLPVLLFLFFSSPSLYRCFLLLLSHLQYKSSLRLRIWKG